MLSKMLEKSCGNSVLHDTKFFDEVDDKPDPSRSRTKGFSLVHVFVVDAIFNSEGDVRWLRSGRHPTQVHDVEVKECYHFSLTDSSRDASRKEVYDDDGVGHNFVTRN